MEVAKSLLIAPRTKKSSAVKIGFVSSLLDFSFSNAVYWIIGLITNTKAGKSPQIKMVYIKVNLSKILGYLLLSKLS